MKLDVTVEMKILISIDIIKYTNIPAKNIYKYTSELDKYH